MIRHDAPMITARERRDICRRHGAIGIIPSSFVYAYARGQLSTINSLKGIASPNVVGACVLLGLLVLRPVVYKRIATKSA